MLNKILKAGILLLLTPWLLVACQVPMSNIIEPQQVDCYFQYEYVNHAWGFNHGGFTITPAGEVYTFDKTTPWTFADNNLIPISAFKNNISASAKRDTLISHSEVVHYQQLAFIAIIGKMSTPEQQGADMGGLVCKIIVPDTTSTNNYREIILSQTGDIEFHNLSPEAGLIKDWLAKIRLP